MFLELGWQGRSAYFPKDGERVKVDRVKGS